MTSEAPIQVKICGFTEPADVQAGMRAGVDAFILSRLVGPKGHVHGVDMTEAQLEVGRRTLDWHMERFGHAEPNVAFHQGYIEQLSMLEDDSVLSVNSVPNLLAARATASSPSWWASLCIATGASNIGNFTGVPSTWVDKSG